jgi:hypothetical protein
MSNNHVRFQVVTAVTMKNVVFLDVTSCALVGTYVSEGCIASIIRMARIGELVAMSAATGTRRTLLCISSQSSSVASYC